MKLPWAKPEPPTYTYEYKDEEVVAGNEDCPHDLWTTEVAYSYDWDTMSARRCLRCPHTMVHASRSQAVAR